MNKHLETLDLNAIIMKIASEFINIPYQDFSKVVQETLGLIGEYLDIDRVYVFEYNFVNNTADNTYEWCHEGVESQQDFLRNYPISEMVDEWVVFHKQGRNVIYEDVDLLDHDSYIYQTLAPQKIQSLCTIPLMINEECYGFVGFDDIRQKRKWSKIDLDLLRVLSELIINALTKHKNDQLMIELKLEAQRASNAKGIFLAQMSHEIRTPLNGVYNAFHLLKQTSYSAEQKRYLDIADTSLNLLSSIINNILDISKIEAGKMEVREKFVDLEFELIKTIKTLRPAIKQKNLECFLDFDYNINHEILCDMTKINQIIINLINNATKYTDFGYIKTSISIFMENSINYLSISVEDTGSGISESDKNKLFEAFFQPQNRSNVQGSGLGLSIVHKLVTLLNGELTIESTLGHGSKFRFVIPIKLGSQLQYSHNNKKMLLIADDSSNHQFYLSLLKSVNNEIDTPECYNHQYYDVIILDDEAIKRHNTKNIIDAHRSKKTQVILVTESLKQPDYVDYITDFPVSRKSLLHLIKNDRDAEKQDQTTDKTFNGNILIVDDNEINREALMAILSKYGFTCTGASSGYEAIEKINAQTFHMVMMDVQMPEMDGYETSRNIRDIMKNQTRIPIIIVTANAFLNDYDIKMAEYVDDLIYKPIDIELLIGVIERFFRPLVLIKIPDELMIFNIQFFDGIFESNFKAGIKMATKFIESFTDDIKEISDLRESSQNDLLYKKLHYFKGPLSYFGADRLIYVIDEMMNRLKSNQSITINDILLLTEEGRFFIDIISNHIKTLS